MDDAFECPEPGISFHESSVGAIVVADASLDSAFGDGDCCVCAS